MSEIKNFKLIKVSPVTVMFSLHPVSNPQLGRTISLTNRIPFQVLPLDWAMGVFADPEVYQLYKEGAITFENNSEAVAAAIEAGVYFDEALDFTPAKPDQSKEILATLKAGNRQKILEAIEEYGQETVKNVAMMNIEDLTQGIVSMLENVLKVQFVIDGE